MRKLCENVGTFDRASKGYGIFVYFALVGSRERYHRISSYVFRVLSMKMWKMLRKVLQKYCVYGCGRQSDIKRSGRNFFFHYKSSRIDIVRILRPLERFTWPGKYKDS